MAVSKITIVGAGLGGSLLAIYLARRGYNVHVFERRGDLRREPAEPGRSIKLTLAERGLAALRELGLEEEVKSGLCVPLRGRAVHSGNGTVVYQPYGKNDQEVIHSFSRNDLNCFLLTVAEKEPTLSLHFHQRCVDLDKENAAATFRDTRTSREVRVEADLVVGADGAFSIVRQLMQRRERADYHQEFLPWGYKELTIRATAPGRPPLDRHAFHLWPCGDQFLFALPNVDGSLCGVCVLPFTGEQSWESLRSDEEILGLLQERFGDLMPFMPDALQEFKTRPISTFITIRTSRWHHKDKVVLLGDAAHSIVPFYGQGMNAAFEDASTLNRLLEAHRGDCRKVLPEFQRLRKPGTDILAQLSIDNFHELRDTVRRPVVTARKRTAIFLNRLLRQHSVPLYTMISHSTLPMAECVEKHKRQERIARFLGLDLAVGLVALWVRLRVLRASYKIRTARAAESPGGKAAATTIAVPLPAIEPEPKAAVQAETTRV
ncbi:MAG TPA: NAD(P)/FAD-dependent oxidoreductase [Thermoanaerobaculia bacterium]